MAADVKDPAFEVWLAVTVRGWDVHAATEREAVRKVKETVQKAIYAADDGLGIDGVIVGEASGPHEAWDPETKKESMPVDDNEDKPKEENVEVSESAPRRRANIREVPKDDEEDPE